MLFQHKRRDSHPAVFTPFIVGGRTQRILLILLTGSGGLIFKHGMVSTTEFKMIGELAPEERTRTKGAALVVHVLRQELVITGIKFFRSALSFY